MADEDVNLLGIIIHVKFVRFFSKRRKKIIYDYHRYNYAIWETKIKMQHKENRKITVKTVILANRSDNVINLISFSKVQVEIV